MVDETENTNAEDDWAAAMAEQAISEASPGLNAQPAGMAFSRGMAPSIWSSRSRSSPMAGMEPINPTV